MKSGGEVGRIALPILLAMIPDSVISLVSMVTASRIGTEAVAGTGLASYLFFIMNAVASVFMVGLLVIASQAYGSGDIQLVERALGESITASLLLSLTVVLTAPAWLAAYVGILSGGQAEVSGVALTCLSLRMLSVPALILNTIIATAYRAVEKPWPSTYSSLSVGVSGALLIPSLTLGLIGLPALGVSGMGLASAISQYVGLGVYAFFRLPARIRPCVPSRTLLKILAVGVPTSIERIVSSVGQNIYINVVARSGLEALAAHNIGLSIENLVINPVFAVGVAASAKVGHRVGSNNVRDLDSLTKEALRIGVSWMSVATAILIIISPSAGRLFTSEPEVSRLATVYFILAAVSEIGLGASQALYGVFRGLGSTWVPLAISSFTVLVLRAFLAQAIQPLYGIYGVWFTQITDMYGRFAISYITYSRLKTKLVVKVV